MSWYSRKPSRVLYCVVAALGLNGCFQPLYGPINGVNAGEELRAVAVEPIPERLGHYLHNELVMAFDGTGGGTPPRYRLEVVVRERLLTPLVDTFSGRADAATIAVEADYTLVPFAGGEPVTTGTTITNATYDRSAQRFANIRAARDSEIRVAKTLADQIRTRIAVSLISPHL